MKKVLFTHSYFYRFDKKQWDNKQYYPPLGTITAAAYIREQGYDVSLFDTNLAYAPKDIIPQLEKEQPDFLVIYDDGFNYLTKMCLTLMREAAFELIRIGKKYNCTIIVSSSDSTDHADDYLAKGADVILLGEGEKSLLDVLNSDEQKKDLSTIRGIVFSRDGEMIHTGRREVIENLDALPMAAWDLVEMERYRDIWLRNHGYFSLNLATTRGCPYSCNWCAKPIYGRKYNVRSPQNVVAEISFLMKTYGASYFWICDDIFGLKSGWVQQFRDEVKKNNLDFQYMMQSRVDVMLKDDSIKAMAESGLDIVWVGAESGSQKVLDAMDKGIKIEQIYEARKKLKEHGVRVAFFLQFGYPGETKQDILLTEKMLFDLMPDDMGISVSYPLPGTKFHEMVKEDLKQKANWTDSDELALMFKNTYPAEFYKRLHRYLHKKFRKRQGLQRIRNFIHHPVRHSHGIVRTIVATVYYIPMTMYYKYLMSKAETHKP
ncbi:MAG: B12-binding domain-containing radical SAM protein [Bacteroidetes bacterium]|nr:B12-binding domain-containing radical SAM protein [Bacteroidota bacterium]